MPHALLPWNYNTAQVYPAPDCSYRPTLHFLNYRDGRDDYLYLFTLETLLEQASGKGLEESAACQKAKAFLERMKDRIYLDSRMYQIRNVDAKEATLPVHSSEWNATSFERYRWRVATLIIDVQKVMEAK